MRSDDWYRIRAKELYADEGTLEFDDVPVVSKTEPEGDKGAYVACWVWVAEPNEEEHTCNGITPSTVELCAACKAEEGKEVTT